MKLIDKVMAENLDLARFTPDKVKLAKCPSEYGFKNIVDCEAGTVKWTFQSCIDCWNQPIEEEGKK